MTPATCSVIRQISNTYLALNNHSSIVATGSASIKEGDYSFMCDHVCSATYATVICSAKLVVHEYSSLMP